MAVMPHLVAGVWVGGEERAIHFNSMSIGQASNAAIPVFGRFILKVFDDASITDVRPEDTFDAPQVINFSLDCSDKGINADADESVPASDAPRQDSGDQTDCGESDIFNF